jgi:tripartite-type tricarboxylate transporter receptor subunit TctC
VNDAVGGHIDLVIGSVALLTPQVQGGTLRPIVQTGKTRVSALPNVPTVGESGFGGDGPLPRRAGRSHPG